MEKTTTVDNFLNDWNGLFPDMPLSLPDLKKPQAVMAALFHLFDRFGISRDAVLMYPEDPDEHTGYYRDLLPVMNTTRIVNHIIANLQPSVNLTFSIMHLLQPTTMKSYSMLMVLFNLLVFNESRLEEIAPSEEELFSHKDEVKKLTEKKDNLIHMRNTLAVEKGNRKERLEQLDLDIARLEEEVKHEKEVEAEVLQELEAILEENKQTDILLEQKKAHRDAILAENARKKDLKVYDADDIRGQAEQAAQNVKEADEKLNTLSAILTQKESSLNNLQTLKPVLDQTNTLLHDIMKFADSIKEFESGDLDADSAEGELDVLETELDELDSALADARAVSAQQALHHKERRERRARTREEDDKALLEAEESVKRAAEQAEKAGALTRSAKDATRECERQCTAGQAELNAVKQEFEQKVDTLQENLLDKMRETTKKVEEQSRRRRRL